MIIHSWSSTRLVNDIRSSFILYAIGNFSIHVRLKSQHGGRAKFVEIHGGIRELVGSGQMALSQ